MLAKFQFPKQYRRLAWRVVKTTELSRNNRMARRGALPEGYFQTAARRDQTPLVTGVLGEHDAHRLETLALKDAQRSFLRAMLHISRPRP